jgi:hypothetical protein
MKKVLSLLLLVCIILPITVYAEQPEAVDGYFTYVPLGCAVEKWADDNQIFRDCTDVGDYHTGDFLGTSTEVYDMTLHGSQDNFVYEDGWYKGTVTFTGTVGDRTGTMEIRFVGKSPGNIFVWSGTWRIVSGTGELSGIHGQGTWENAEDPSMGVHYSGRIHFNP